MDTTIFSWLKMASAFSFAENQETEHVKIVKFENVQIKVENGPTVESNFTNLSPNNVIDKEALDLKLENFLHESCNDEINKTLTNDKVQKDSESNNETLQAKEERVHIPNEKKDVKDNAVIKQEIVSDDASIRQEFLNKATILIKQEIISDNSGDEHEVMNSSRIQQQQQQEISDDQRIADVVMKYNSLIKRELTSSNQRDQTETGRLFLDHTRAAVETIIFDHKKVQTSYSR